jgi:NAD(P)-dependent dehydrogenase (short-subunit alcohol dehydrogenase family)
MVINPIATAEPHMSTASSSTISRTAIVTGAGSGIGAAVAHKLATDGFHVGVLDIDATSAVSVAKAISDAGGEARSAQVDVSNEAQFNAAVDAVCADLGPVAIMVNNAGILDGYQDVDELDLNAWTRVMDIDINGVFLGCKRALRDMLPAGHGRLINMASIAGLNGTGGGAAYVAAKHAVVGLTRQMAVVYGARGVTSNCVCPGVIPTNLRANTQTVLGNTIANTLARGIATTDEQVAALVPAQVRGSAEDIANAVAFLASDAASYINGHSLVVDGGLRAK